MDFFFLAEPEVHLRIKSVSLEILTKLISIVSMRKVLYFCFQKVSFKTARLINKHTSLVPHIVSLRIR